MDEELACFKATEEYELYVKEELMSEDLIKNIYSCMLFSKEHIKHLLRTIALYKRVKCLEEDDLSSYAKTFNEIEDEIMNLFWEENKKIFDSLEKISDSVYIESSKQLENFAEYQRSEKRSMEERVRNELFDDIEIPENLTKNDCEQILVDLSRLSDNRELIEYIKIDDLIYLIRGYQNHVFFKAFQKFGIDPRKKVEVTLSNEAKEIDEKCLKMIKNQ